MALDPDFPVVSGDLPLNADWTLTLPFEMNRRMDDQDLVLWRPGFSVWLSLWTNDNRTPVEERLNWLRSAASPDAFDVVVQTDRPPARYSYRVDEQRDEGMVHALHGFVLKDSGHVQVGICADREDDVPHAQSLLQSLR